MRLIYFMFVAVSLFWASTILANLNTKIVGSSTVYPFVTIVAETFARKNPQFQTPIVEATGTGGGFKAFCEGSGIKNPDFNNASRPIKADEIKLCNTKGVSDIKEVVLGYDGIVIIHPKSLNKLSLTTDDIFLAVAEKIPSNSGSLINNPYKNWSDINKSLPNIPIRLMGPPSTSGTRDSFIELVMHTACDSLIKKDKLSLNEQEKKILCNNIRRDGAWINGGENDLLIVRKVSESRDTLAVIGYGYFAQNEKSVSAVSINSIAPDQTNLTSRKYPLIRPLYSYVKAQSIANKPGVKEFTLELVSKSAIGDNGYLKKTGLIPLTTKEYDSMINKLNIK